MSMEKSRIPKPILFFANINDDISKIKEIMHIPKRSQTGIWTKGPVFEVIGKTKSPNSEVFMKLNGL